MCGTDNKNEIRLEEGTNCMKRRWMRNPPHTWLFTSAASPLLLMAASWLAVDKKTPSMASSSMWQRSAGLWLRGLVQESPDMYSQCRWAGYFLCWGLKRQAGLRISEVPSNSNVVLNAEEPADIVVQSFERDKGCPGEGRRDDRRDSRWGRILSRDVKVGKEASLRALSWAGGHSVRGRVETASPTEKGFRPSDEVRAEATGNWQPF